MRRSMRQTESTGVEERLTCVRPERGGQVRVCEERLRKLSMVFIKQSGESSNTQPEQVQVTHTHTSKDIVLNITLELRQHVTCKGN